MDRRGNEIVRIFFSLTLPSNHNMDSLDNLDPELSALSYDDDVAYEDQHPTHPSNDPGRAALANRIGTSKVYLLSESSTARVGKVRW